jgi:hypothetical protein
MNSSTLKHGGKGRKHRSTRRRDRVTKNNKVLYQSNIKVKKFKDIKDRNLPKKGIAYSIEKPDVISRDNTIEGDIIKKYVDGKLVDQKFVTKNKMLEMSQNYKKLIVGGAVRQIPEKNVEIRPVEPAVVRVQDDTSFLQSFKSGVAFALAFEFIGSIFDN